jgi:NhaP-type Na+/H+ or K+/H+ antiporter
MANLLIVILVGAVVGALVGLALGGTLTRLLVELDSRFCAPTTFKKLGADPLPE